MNQLCCWEKMADANLHTPKPMDELIPTDSTDKPVMSPRIECGV